MLTTLQDPAKRQWPAAPSAIPERGHGRDGGCRLGPRVLPAEQWFAWVGAAVGGCGCDEIIFSSLVLQDGPSGEGAGDGVSVRRL